MKHKKKQRQNIQQDQAWETLKKSFWPSKYTLAIMLPNLMVAVMADAEQSRGAAYADWVWMGMILLAAVWLYRITKHLIWLDITGEGIVPMYSLERGEIRLINGIKLILVPLVVIAVIRAMSETHYGYTAFASVYLGFTLFLFLIIRWRRQVLQRWVRDLAEGTGIEQIILIDDPEQIQEPGWYLLQKYPAQVIRITEDNEKYAAVMQLETVRTWQPLCRQNEKPMRERRLSQLVRALSKSIATTDTVPDKVNAEWRLSQ